MNVRPARPLLDRTRILLEEARSVICGSLEPAAEEPRTGRGTNDVLSLYEELRARLSGIDDRRVQTLLSEIARNVEELGGLAEQAERLRALRASLARHPL